MAEDKSRFTTHDKRLTRLDLWTAEVKEGDLSKMGDLRATLIAVLVETTMLMGRGDLLEAIENRRLEFDWGEDDSAPGKSPVRTSGRAPLGQEPEQP